METLLLYIMKVFLTSGVMFLYYKVFLKDRTFHHYNRFYLLATVVVSLLLPLLKVSYFTVEISSDNRLLNSTLKVFNSTKYLYDDHFYSTIALLLIGLVAVLFLIRLFAGILTIFRIKKNYPVENFEGIKFYQTDLQNAPFSFFRNIFWKNSILISSDLGRQILKHEMVHIEQKHSFDKMFMEVVTAVVWVNPVFFVIRKELNLIHEYLADKKALKNSDTKAFAQMLLSGHFSADHYPATSPFLSSNLKKRLIMLKKSKTKFGYARKILALPILFLLTFAYLVNAKNKEIIEINTQIKQQVETLKNDTIRPQSKQKLQPGSRKTENLKALEQLNVQNKKAMEISERLQTKSSELQELAKNKDFSIPRFEELGKEMTDLTSELNELFKSDQQLGIDKSLAEIEKIVASESSRLNLNETELKAEAVKILKTPEFKAKIRELEEKAKELAKTVNTPAFRQRLRDAEKNAEKARKLLNSPQFKERIRSAEAKVKKAAKMSAHLQETEQSKISPGINRIYSEKEISEMRRDAERMRISAEKLQEEKRKAQNFRIAIFKADVSSVLIYDAAGKILSEKVLPPNPVGTDLNHSKLYVNGRPVSPDEFERFSADQMMMENKKESNIKTLTFARTGDINKSKLDRIEIITK